MLDYFDSFSSVAVLTTGFQGGKAGAIAITVVRSAVDVLVPQGCALALSVVLRMTT